MESQAAERNRLLKLLETANIKLASVASDVFGVSGRAMLKAPIEGSASLEAMADLARGQLRTMLVGATISAARTKGSYLKDKFHRLKARRGALRAALAIAHKILVAAYHMLAKNLPYRDLGEAYLDQISQTRTIANLKRRLDRLGYKVTLEQKAEPA